MQLAKNYYHCFLGNGLDAVLVGYTGSMVSDRVSVDRCAWYKSDRYYPEDKLVMVAGRWPLDKPLEHAPESEHSGWYDAAPIGRTWYFVMNGNKRLELQASKQHFTPQEGTLYSDVDYGAVKGKVETWLHATRSILIERYTFEQEVEFQAWMGPGVWNEDNGMPWDTDPFRSVTMSDDALEGRYDLGETQGIMALRVEPGTGNFSKDGNDRCVTVRGKSITKYFLITDNRQSEISTQALDEAVALGYEALRAEHLAFWQKYFSVSSISIPDEQIQYFYDAAMYHMKAMQSRTSGGIPVNNLRRTWSSHVFWDAYFMQRALLEANHRDEALEGCRFFQRTIDHARRHARDEFGCDGLKWDWEITHDGRKAYGKLLHMKYQVHNNGSYANILWGYYEYTQDKAYLAEFFPILEGLATFFMNCIVEEQDGGYGIGFLVGVHESPTKVRNDGTNLAGTIAILRHYSDAAKVLERETEFSKHCAEVAVELTKRVDTLYNGRFFKASEEDDRINMSSITPIFPMTVISPFDPRAISTSEAYIERYGGRVLGDGMHDRAFPWSAGVLGAILAWQHQGDQVWQAIDGTRPTICEFGGMTEVMENGEWNMQYFGTAEGACCIALQQMLLESGTGSDKLELFPALPAVWNDASFENLLADGLTVTASWKRASGVEWSAHNISAERLTRQLCYGDQSVTVELQPGETRQGSWV